MFRKTLKSIPALVVSVVLASATSWADVTVVSNASGKGIGVGAEGKMIQQIKGNKMRSESTFGKDTMVSIMDLDAMKMYNLNPSKKEAEVYDLASLTQDLQKNLGGNVTVNVTRTGKTQQLLGHRCENYLVTITVPVSMGEGSQQKLDGVMNCDMWVAKGVPGTQDMLNLYKVMGEKKVFFGDPRAMKGPSAGNIKGQNEFYQQFVKLGGIPLLYNMNIKFNAEGLLGAMISKMGFDMTITVTDVKTTPLDDSLFAVPAGWKIKEKK